MLEAMKSVVVLTTQSIATEIVQASSKERRSNMNRLNGSHHEFTDRARQIFTERGFKEVGCESTLNGEFLVFTQNEALHLVYCLPHEMYVTTIEIQACWEAQSRRGAQSSTVVAPSQFSKAAIHHARKRGIELLVVGK
jgi:Restriction endonuclease